MTDNTIDNDLYCSGTCDLCCLTAIVIKDLFIKCLLVTIIKSHHCQREREREREAGRERKGGGGRETNLNDTVDLSLLLR